MGLTLPGASKALHPMAPASPIPLYHFHLLHCFGYFFLRVISPAEFISSSVLTI